jgi:hypothetical protein
MEILTEKKRLPMYKGGQFIFLQVGDKLWTLNQVRAGETNWWACNEGTDSSGVTSGWKRGSMRRLDPKGVRVHRNGGIHPAVGYSLEQILAGMRKREFMFCTPMSWTRIVEIDGDVHEWMKVPYDLD